ncbi:MAG: hypothetical protein GC180_11475 [Bacteroidetes bacterium]|nr:hypothetical protein [Bacteroidota bacterium]
MKTWTIASYALALAGFSACSGSGNVVPKEVHSAFTQMYPNAKNVKWDKEGDSEWEAEFTLDGEEYSANFLNDGPWKETEYDIEITDIPEPVKNTIEQELVGYTIEEAEMSETPEGKFYEFVVEMGPSELEVVITPEGKLIKKQSKETESEKEND